MIVHVLRFSLVEGASDADRDLALATFAAVARLPPVRFSSIGQNLGAPVDGYIHAFCVAFDDLDALERYMFDPRHRAADFTLVPLLRRLAIFDMTDDPDPAYGARVLALHERRSAADPEWGRLFSTIPDVVVYG